MYRLHGLRHCARVLARSSRKRVPHTGPVRRAGFRASAPIGANRKWMHAAIEQDHQCSGKDGHCSTCALRAPMLQRATPTSFPRSHPADNCNCVKRGRDHGIQCGPSPLASFRHGPAASIVPAPSTDTPALLSIHRAHVQRLILPVGSVIDRLSAMSFIVLRLPARRAAVAGS